MERLLNELNMVKKSYDVELVDDNIYKWHIAVNGPDGTPYQGGTFLLRIEIPPNYPFASPSAIFETMVYHPNINKKGEMCISMLDNNWKPSYSIDAILTSIVNILTNPDPNNPVDVKVCGEYLNHRQRYIETATMMTKKYAIV